MGINSEAYVCASKHEPMDTSVQHKIKDLQDKLDKLKEFSKLQNELISLGLLDNDIAPPPVKKEGSATAPRTAKTRARSADVSKKEGEVVSVIESEGRFLTVDDLVPRLKEQGKLDASVLNRSFTDQKRFVSRALYRIAKKGVIKQHPKRKRNGGWGLSIWFDNEGALLEGFSK